MPDTLYDRMKSFAQSGLPCADLVARFKDEAPMTTINFTIERLRHEGIIGEPITVTLDTVTDADLEWIPDVHYKKKV